MTILSPRPLVSVVALFILAGCNGAAGTSGRSRDFKSTTEPFGNRHPVKAEINANGTITCTSAIGKGSTACYVNTSSGGYQVLEPGESTGTGTGVSMILTCNGTGALACVVTVKD